MHGSGLSSAKLSPELDYTFPSLEPFKLGLTNLAHRPTRSSDQLTTGELLSGVPDLVRKVAQYKPKVVCFVGKQIAQAFLRGLRGHLGEEVQVSLPNDILLAFDKEMQPPDAGYGVLDACVEHEDGTVTLFFATPSTSARVTHHQLPGKIRIMGNVTAILSDEPQMTVSIAKITGIS